MTTITLDGFNTPRVFDNCAESGDPQFITGHMAEFTRKNPDGTFTVVESVWGVRCRDWDGGEPVGPYTCSQALIVTICSDIEDIGSSEIDSNTVYFDGPHGSVDDCDRTARDTVRDEAARNSVSVPASNLELVEEMLQRGLG